MNYFKEYSLYLNTILYICNKYNPNRNTIT